jgi:hypothetical protein
VEFFYCGEQICIQAKQIFTQERKFIEMKQIFKERKYQNKGKINKKMKINK